MSKSKLTRRQFLKISGLGALTLSGLSSFPQKTSAENEVSWLMHPVHYNQMGKGELLEKLYSEIGIKVKAIQMPFPQYREKLWMLLRQGSTDFDIVGISSFWMDGALMEFLEPLDSFMNKKPLIDQSDILSLNTFKVNDSFYGIPYRVGAKILFFRKDIYKKYGLKVPRTMEEYKDNARFITKKETGVFGTQIFGEQSFFTLEEFVTYLYSFGGAFFDSPDLKKAKVILNNKNGLDTIKFWVSLKEEGLVPPGVLSATWETFITNMQQGKIAQSVQLPVYIAPINDPQKSKVAGLVDWAEVPYGENSGLSHGQSPMLGWGIWIPKASQKKELSWEVMRWISSPKSDLYMALHEGGPFRASTYNMPEYKKYNPATEVVRNALQHVVPTWNPMGVIKNATEVTDKVVLELTSALAGKKSPKDAIDKSAEIVRSIVLG
jgi:multiple sugar transport system substrate-binding protein